MTKMESAECVESMEAKENLEGGEDVESMEAKENLEGGEDMESMEAKENLEGGEDVETVDPLEICEISFPTTVSIDDQRAYIKVETLLGKNPTEIHRILKKVCGDSTVNRSTVSRWAARFRSGRMSVHDNARPGRPKTTTDEVSIKLVAEAVVKDPRATCDEIALSTGIPPSSVYRILTTELKKKKMPTGWE